MGRINAYTTASTLPDYAIVDGTHGTKKVTKDQLVSLFRYDNKAENITEGEQHAQIYRGNDLGVFSEKHMSAIADGSFDDIYIGDYWVPQTPSDAEPDRWIVADINYYYGLINSTEYIDGRSDRPHLIALANRPTIGTVWNFNGIFVDYFHRNMSYNAIMPDGAWPTNSQQNAGVVSSNAARRFCGNQVMARYTYESLGAHGQPFTGGAGSWGRFSTVTDIAEFKVSYSIMTEAQIFGGSRGATRWGCSAGTSRNNHYIGDNRQFALFKMMPWLHHFAGNDAVWLRDLSGPEVASSTTSSCAEAHVCVLCGSGDVYVHGSAETHYVWPYIVIG